MCTFSKQLFLKKAPYNDRNVVMTMMMIIIIIM